MLRIEHFRQRQELKRKELRSLRKEVEELDSEIKLLNAVEHRIGEAIIKIDEADKVLGKCRNERTALKTEQKNKNKAILDGEVDITFWEEMINVLKKG
jgi:chromosome segregation ATPase